MEYQELIDNFLHHASIIKTLKRGEQVYNLQELGDTIYFVQYGAVKIGYDTDEKEVILEFGLENDFITNLFTFLTGLRSNLKIQALRQTKLLGIPRPYLSRLLRENPQMAKGYTHILENIIVERLQKETLLFLSSPADRINTLLKYRPKLFRLVPLKYIARYLNLAPETISRQLNVDSNQ